MISVLITLFAVLGLLVGSFLNVVAYRVPAGLSVVSPRSACPGCGHPIGALDNVPVLSWLVLRGRCRHCQQRISIRYPLIEAATAVLFVLTWQVVGLAWVLPGYFWFVALTFVLAIIDLETKRLPNRIMYPGTAIAVAILTVGAIVDGESGALLRAALGGLAYFAAMYGLAIAARGGFGFGDVKLAFVLGVFVTYASWGSVAVAAVGGFVIGGVVAVGLLAARRAQRKSAIPFGPSMVVAAWLAIVWGEPIWEWYRGLSG